MGLVLLLTGLARAGGNDPEKAQARAEEGVLLKISAACGVPLSITYDGESLRKHNPDIQHDQNDGDTECNEPLRYLWYACQTNAGKAAVKAARISKVVCRGVPGGTGTLELGGGTLTAGRSADERRAFLRSRKQFEALLKVTLKLSADDPYEDEKWRELPGLPNPVLSTTTYCLVNGEKVDLRKNGTDPFTDVRRKTPADGWVKCWNDGVLVSDLRIKGGKKTGFLTRFYDKVSRRITFRDDQEHGQQWTAESGKLTMVASYENGRKVWEKELHPNGALKRYWHKLSDGYGELTMNEAGRVYRLECTPAARDDRELRQLCGFNGAVTTSVYDGTGKVNRVLTWKKGVLQKEGAGDSSYAQRAEVGYADGKKNGQERVLRKDGTVESAITWNRGVKDGRELAYSDDGKKVVKETVWKAGEVQQVTDLFLNGNPKRREVYDGRDKRRVTAYWDTGKVQAEGDEVACKSNPVYRGYQDWCEEGLHKSYYEDGSHASEDSYRGGERQGPAKSWWENGQPRAVEEYAADKLAKAKRWDSDGKLVTDEEYEADGSRKLKK